MLINRFFKYLVTSSLLLTPCVLSSIELAHSVVPKVNRLANLSPNVSLASIYHSDDEFLHSVMVDKVNDLVSNDYLAKAGLLCDLKEKKIVWEKQMFESMPIASVTKMMVALLVLEDVKAGKLTWDTKVNVSLKASRVAPSKVYLRVGESFTIRDLMKAAMIASGNDACFLLAESNGGTEYKFVQRMNKRALELGMKSTKFSNSTGLPDPAGKDNYSSPVDLLLLAKELVRSPELINITSLQQESILHGRRRFIYNNHNKLVIEYNEEVDGLKTGYTRKAGYCIVATSNKKDHRLISIVLGAERSASRNFLVAEMMSNYYISLGLGRLGN